MLCKMCEEKEVVKETDGYPGMCESCVKEKEEIIEFVRLGHTHHCACRQVWGDRECECGKKE